MSDGRKELKEAGAKVAQITATIDQLEKAKTSAARIAQNATARLEGFANLNKEITQHRVNAVKSGLGTQSLPESIKQKVTAKRDAEEEREQAEVTLTEIEKELQTARATLIPAEAEMLKAAKAVLRGIANGVAEELIELNDRRWKLMQIIVGLRDLNLFAGQYWKVVGSTPTMEAALISGAPEFLPGQDPIGGMGKRWKSRLDTLLQDPDASLTIPAPITPGDFNQMIVYPESPDGRFMMPLSKTTIRPEA